MFVTFSGCSLNEIIGVLVKAVYRTNKKSVRVTIDPIVIYQLPHEK